ncbi:hypothetical protein GCM10010964_21530 [Caldovatus sediminis]|uniref:Zinc finger/thioredoxin putative domain-containing protein n=1 Tax=Caldovatus sediminis TaxID=2041189 RepID=A0A8J3EC83_9PROT|nr:zinc-ribbon domain-containing protein [Caldovatus sediminis]GGG33350.1 hypothetical protein GCM10010964_21530 [Caldovatus sediminis]
MRLTCPTCAAVYEVPDRLLADGARRPVRCTRCGAVWAPAAAEPGEPQAMAGEAPARPASPETGAPPGRAAPAAPRGEMPAFQTVPPAPPWSAAGAAEAAPRPLRAPPPRPPQWIAEERRSFAGPPARDGGRFALVAAWLASLALVAGGIAALWLWRAEVVALWPPAGRLFAWLGG